MDAAELQHQVAAEVCAYCHAAIWPDPDEEVYIDRHDSHECPAASPVDHGYIGSTRVILPGCHDPA